MPVELPPNPSLEQLKKQAKDLRQAHRSTQPDGLTRVRAGLPRLSAVSDAELAAAALSLQECQHVVAVEYGFKDWALLAKAVGAELDDLVQLSDHDAQVLMRQVDQKDLVAALKGAATPVQQKFLKNMSARVRGFIESEIALLEVDESAIDAVRGRILRQVLLLTRDGHIGWDGASRPQHEALFTLHMPPEILALAHRPLEQLTVAQMAALWREIADQARREGILSLQQIEGKAQDPLLREALQLAVDGTEPAVIEQLLTIRSRTRQHRQQMRAEMIIEGLGGIVAGYNPGVIAHILSAYYTDGVDMTDDANGATAKQLMDRFKPPIMALDFARLNALLVNLALLARKEKIAALKPFCQLLKGLHDTDAELLRRGLELLLDREPADRIRTALETQASVRLDGLAVCQRMVLTGISMVQAGKKPAAIEAEVRRVGEAG